MKKVVSYLMWFTVAGILFIFRKTYPGAFVNSYLLFLMPGLLLARFALKDFNVFEKTVLSYSIGQAIAFIIFKTIGIFTGIENILLWSVFYLFLFLAFVLTKYKKDFLKRGLNIILNKKKLVIFSCLLYGPFIGFIVFEILVNGVYDFQGNLILPQADPGFYEAMGLTNEMLRRDLHLPFDVANLAGITLRYPWGAYFNVALLSKLNEMSILTSWKIFTTLNVIHLFLMVGILFKRILRSLRLNAYFVAVLIFIPCVYLLAYYCHYFINFQSRGTGHLVYLAFLIVLFYSRFAKKVSPYITLGMLAGLAGAYTPKPAISLHVAILGYILVRGLINFRINKTYILRCRNFKSKKWRRAKRAVILRKLPLIFSVLLVWFLAGGHIILTYLTAPKFVPPLIPDWLFLRSHLTIIFVFYPLYFFSGICFIAYLRKKIKPLNERLIIFSFVSVITGISLGLLPFLDLFFPKVVPFYFASLVHASLNNFMIINIFIILLISLYYTCTLLQNHTQEFLRIFRSKLVLLMNVLMLSLGLTLWAVNKLQYDYIPRAQYNNFYYLLTCIFFIIFYVSLVYKKRFVCKHVFLTGILLLSPYFICDTKDFVNYHKRFISGYLHPAPTPPWVGVQITMITNKEIEIVNWVAKNIPKDSIFIQSYLTWQWPNILSFSGRRIFLADKTNVFRYSDYDFSKRIEFIKEIYDDSIFDYQSLLKLDLKTCGYALFFDFKRDSRENYKEVKEKYNKQLQVKFENDDFAILYYEPAPANIRSTIS